MTRKKRSAEKERNRIEKKRAEYSTTSSIGPTILMKNVQLFPSNNR